MPQLSEFGAGIQLSANATRIIYNWGLQDAFLKVVNQPAVNHFRRYADDKVIGEIPNNPISEFEYGFPHWTVYRPDFQDLLAEAAAKEGVKIRCGCRVRSVDDETGSLTLEDGTTETADLIIGADGIRSRTRSTLTDVQARPFYEYLFRATIPRAKMESDPSTAERIAGHLNDAWCGPSSAVIGYPIAGGKLYNVILAVSRPSEAPLAKWNQPGDLAEVQEELTPYSPLVKKIWSYVDSCAKWTLGDVPPLESYVSANGKFVLIGDAAHASA